MKIVVDRDRCTGIGICESIAPATFEVDDSGSVTLLSDVVADADATVAEAVRSCPAMALSVVGD